MRWDHVLSHGLAAVYAVHPNVLTMQGAGSKSTADNAAEAAAAGLGANGKMVAYSLNTSSPLQLSSLQVRRRGQHT